MSKPGRPNLSLAGKREAPAQQKQTHGGSTANRGARGRGGRGRGAGPRQKQELIQTGGVFSEGLGGDFPSRKKKEDLDGGQFSYARRDRESGPSSSATGDKKDVKKKITENMEGKASFEGWDALWRSDDEGDETELNTLHPKGFISDLRRGTVMPVVLPLEDQPQFLNVINKSARLQLEEDEQIEEVKKPSKTSSKPAKKTPEQMVAMLEASTSELLHLQLPSVVGSICHTLEAQDETPMEVDDNETAPVAVAPTPRFGLPQSRRIGKLQVTRKGRLLLQVGGHSVDITSKPTSGKQQATVLLEVEPTVDPLNPVFPTGPKVDNQLFHLGSVKHNLVGSMSWGHLNEEKARHENREGTVEVSMEDGDNGESEKRVEQLEREQAAWGHWADKWAAGLSET